MGSPFDALVADLLAPAISGTFGRLWRHQPMTRGADVNAASVVDASRPAGTLFLAALHEPKAKPLIPDAYDPRTNRRPGVETQHPLLRIQPDQVAAPNGAAGPLDVRALDLVLDVDSGVTWRISAVRPNEHGVRECDLQVVG